MSAFIIFMHDFSEVMHEISNYMRCRVKIYSVFDVSSRTNNEFIFQHASFNQAICFFTKAMNLFTQIMY